MAHSWIVALMLWAGCLAFGQEQLAPHGGLIRANKELYLEMVLERGLLKMYPMTRDLKAIPMDAVSIDVIYRAPKEKKHHVAFKKVEDHFEGHLVPANAKHYTLEISTKYKGQKERATFEIKPE